MHHLPTHGYTQGYHHITTPAATSHNEYIPWIWLWWLWQQQFPIGSPALVPEQLLGHTPGDSEIRKCPPIDLCHLRPHRFDPGQPDSPADTGSCRLHWRWVGRYLGSIETILKGSHQVMWRNSLQQGCVSINSQSRLVFVYTFIHYYNYNRSKPSLIQVCLSVSSSPPH